MPITSFGSPSAIAKPGVVANAAARPASPYDGQVVYQQDTDALLIWNGSAWYPPGNMPWGQVGYAKRTSNFTLSSTTTAVTDLSVTWTAVSGRLYKITSSVYFQVTTGTGTVFSAIYTGAGSRTAELGTYAAATSYPSISLVAYESGLSGSQTRKVQCNFSGITAATVLADSVYPSVLIVEDIGPA